MIDPRMISAAVEGLEFPASKDEVVGCAERGDARARCSSGCGAEGERYDDLQELQQAVRRVEVVEAQAGPHGQ